MPVFSHFSLFARPGSIPTTVWVLGFVSLLMDVSSEMVQTLLPLYMVTGLGLTAVTIGLIEAIAIATATATKLFSGIFSDLVGSRKWLVVIGYGLGAVAKPFFPLAEGLGAIVAGRFVDRVGKGIRSAPRDALIADAAPADKRGASFGLRKSLDTVGGFVGPLIAVLVMMMSGGDYRLVFWLAVIPAVFAVVMLVTGIREPASKQGPGKRQSLAGLFKRSGDLGRGFWLVMVAAGILMLARFSEAFLLLQAGDIGIVASYVPLVLVLMHVVYGLCAYPVGVLSDRIGRQGLLIGSIGVLAVADLVIAFALGVGGYLIGIALWGLHMGMSQGLIATLVADHSPDNLRGTAFGIFNLVCGVALILANLIAGIVWEQSGASMTFVIGAGACVVALCFFGLVSMRTALTS
ncbi:MFS transporter [Thalassospira profundimaris]|uniref:MFS transporter n=1 Tax=Thalassospira profundimaris TaxID=502049 RepID=A0A367W116_9PROT|nr:MFS transporter [Thalassospira profundimaris]